SAASRSRPRTDLSGPFPETQALPLPLYGAPEPSLRRLCPAFASTLYLLYDASLDLALPMKIHPKSHLLARLAIDLPADKRQYLAHVATCPACRERLAALLDREPLGAAGGVGVLRWPEPPGVDRLLQGSAPEALVNLRAAFARGEAEAAELLAELLAEPAA